MEALPAEAALSLRKSRLRTDVLFLVNSLGEAYVGQVAHMLGVTPNKVRWALVGRLPYYSPERSLVAQGLVRFEQRERLRVIVITQRGRRKARSVMAARRRFGRRA